MLAKKGRTWHEWKGQKSDRDKDMLREGLLVNVQSVVFKVITGEF